MVFSLTLRASPSTVSTAVYSTALYTAAEPAVRSAVKILVSQRNDVIKAFYSRLTKIKTVHKFLRPLLVVYLSIPGLI